MCAEASAVLRAVAADSFFNCWYLEIPSDNRIRYIPRCVHCNAKVLCPSRPSFGKLDLKLENQLQLKCDLEK
jgi:hypothetical protein